MTESSYEQLQGLLRDLQEEADAICKLDLDTELERILICADTYTTQLDSWREQVEKIAPFDAKSPWSGEQKESFRNEIKRFQEKHLHLTERLSGARDVVTQQMGDLHKRAKALRTYVDRFPARITIAGKRKG